MSIGLLGGRVRGYKLSSSHEIDYVLCVFNIHFVYGVKLFPDGDLLCRLFQIEVY